MIISADNIQELQKLADDLRLKAIGWCNEGVHERAADLIEMAECAEHIIFSVEHMKRLASKCPCCYRKHPIN